MAIPFAPYTFTDAVANDVTAARLNAIAQAARDAQLLPAVRVFHSANQSIASGAAAQLAFNSERFDQASGSTSTQHDTVTNNSRLTALFAGVYAITANVEFAANATGQRYVAIKLNGGGSLYAVDRRIPSGGIPTTFHISTLLALAVNDFVQVEVFQDSGGALNVSAIGNYSPEFMMVRVA